jgi:hypothetical protein
LKTRPLTDLAGMFGSHQYLYMHDRNNNTVVVEGGPTTFVFGDWGKLEYYSATNGSGLKGNDPQKDATWGGTMSFPQSVTCNKVDEIVTTAKNFKATADYQLSGPNSNSFMRWMLDKSSMSPLYPLPPTGAVGWYVPIPGNP